jgi:hypothetical protein
VLASVGSVGDAYDNALAESFVDSFKTELIADRTWRSRSQLELATCRLVQQRPPAREPRRRPAGRVRTAAGAPRSLRDFKITVRAETSIPERESEF